MAANSSTRYTPQDFVSFYDKIPYQEIGALMQMKDDRFAQGQTQAEDFLGDLYKVKSLPQDQAKKTEILKGYEDALNKTLQESKNDYSTIIPKVNSLKRDLARNLYLQDMQGKYNNELARQEEIRKNRDSYKGNEAQVDALYRQLPLKNYKGQEEIAPGLFNQIDYGQLPTYADIAGDVSKEFKNFKGISEAIGFRDLGNGYYQHGTNDKVSAETVQDAVNSYIVSKPEYQNQLRDIAKYHGPEAMQDYVNGITRSMIAREAGNKLNVGYSKNWMQQDAMRQEAENPMSSSQLDTGEYDPVLSNPVIQGSTNWFDQNGNLQAERTYTGPDTKLTGPGEKAFNAYAKRRGIDLPKSNTTVQNPDYVPAKSIIEGLRKNAPNATKGMTDKQVMELHVQSLGESGQISYNSFQLQGLNPESTSKFVSSNLAGKKFMIDGDLQAMTFEQMAENLGLDNEELRKEVEKSKTVGIKPSSPNNPGAFKVQVFDGDGKPKSITIEGNKTQQDFFREYDNLMSLDKASTPGEVHTNNYYAKTEQTEVQTPEGYKVQFGTIIHPLSQSTASLEDIKSTYGSLENAKSQGITFVPVGKGTYKLVLDKQSINPQELGQSLVDRFKLEKMKDLHNKQKKSVDYTDTEE